jgi:hypothetical protein
MLACVYAGVFEKEVAELKNSHTGFRHAGMPNIPADSCAPEGSSLPGFPPSFEDTACGPARGVL